MGGVVSSADDNDELIDNLVTAGYVKTPEVERALRCVDRGHYFLDGARNNAYRDLAWKHGFLHVSAPCIYAEVLECLNLRPGLSFLNLGSGTGYLSTIAGFLLGTYGQNYGIELHKEAVEYANKKLKLFMQQSFSLDFASEFCSPQFLVGNCLQLDIATNIQSFDRVYCGAAVPPEHLDFVRNLVKIGGIVVMPHEDQLLQIKRLGVNNWDQTRVLPVSFATMVVPTREQLICGSTLSLPPREPLSLLEICRAKTREALQLRLIEENHFTLRSLVTKYRNHVHNNSHRGYGSSDDRGTDGDGSSENGDGGDSAPSGNNNGVGGYSAMGVNNGDHGGGSVSAGSRGSGRLNPLRRALPFYRRLFVPLFNPGAEQPNAVEAETDHHAGGRWGENRRYVVSSNGPIPGVRWARFFGAEPLYDLLENQRNAEDIPGSSSQQQMVPPGEERRGDDDQNVPRKINTDVLFYPRKKTGTGKYRSANRGGTDGPQPSNLQKERKSMLKYRLKLNNVNTDGTGTTASSQTGQSESIDVNLSSQSEIVSQTESESEAGEFRTVGDTSIKTDSNFCGRSELSEISSESESDPERNFDPDFEALFYRRCKKSKSKVIPGIVDAATDSDIVDDYAAADSDVIEAFVRDTVDDSQRDNVVDREPADKLTCCCSTDETLPPNSDECGLPSSSAGNVIADSCGMGGGTSGDFTAPKRTRTDSDPNTEGAVGPSRCKRSANWDNRSDEEEQGQEPEGPEQDEGAVPQQRVSEEEGSDEVSFHDAEGCRSCNELPRVHVGGIYADSEDEREYEAEVYEQQQLQRERMRAERERNTESVRQLSVLVKSSVDALPLPESLKQYLNFNRK